MNNDYFNHKIRIYLINYFKNSNDVFSNHKIIDMINEFLYPEEQEFIFNKLEQIGTNPVEITSPKKNQFGSASSEDGLLPSKTKKNSNLSKRNIKKYQRILEDNIENSFKEEIELTHEVNDFLQTQIIDGVALPSEISELKKTFNLSASEVEILTLLVAFKYSSTFENFIESFSTRKNTNHRSLRKLYGDFLNIPEAKIANDLTWKSILIKSSLIEIDRYDYEITSSTRSYMLEGDENSFISKYVKLVPLIDLLELSEFPLNPSKLETLITILKSGNPCNILLYGPPGVGKTELSKTLSKLVGKDLYSINISSRDDGLDSREARKTSLVAAQNHPAMNDSLILVDECDSIINSKINFEFNLFGAEKGDEKAWINGYFDENKRQMIWITNSIYKLDDSLVRRFDFTLGFSELNSLQKEKILNSLILKNKCDFLNPEDIKSLSINSKFSSGHFSNALKVVSSIEGSVAQKREHLLNILDEYQVILAKSPLNLKKINEYYSLEGLNIDQDPNKVIDFSRKILERMEQNKSLDLNLNILLFGPPGAGKTEFAKYLAFTLGKELSIKRTSDLISKYVGDSEKLIHRAFQEAEKNNKILFIDEADSLFTKRESAQNSWEVTRVNELLTCMENFKGILICATNFVTNIDMAAHRRFIFKLKFDYLTHSGALHFYKTFFNELNLSELTQEEISQLNSIKGLTPSDFNTLKSKFLVIPPNDNKEVLDLLEGEVGYKAALFKAKIGL